MPSIEARPRGRVITGRIGDPLSGIRQPEPIILPDPAALFSRRAERLSTLADGHVMAEWMRFMARLARAQHAAAMAMPSVATLGPLLTEQQRDPAWRVGLATLLDRIDGDLPGSAADAMVRLRRSDAGALECLADRYLDRQTTPEQSGDAVYVAASLQVYFARLVATLPPGELRLLPQRGRCPVCGSAPVAGVITAAGPAPGVRYLHCGLCATAWNHVRAVCINCGESGSLALHQIEGDSGAAKAETCEACHGYAKMLYQAADMGVEPVADDLASLALDILVAEGGWSRHAPNPLIILG
jgi:FdhE protein